MDIAVLGIDLGKTVCSLAGVDSSGAVVLRRRIQRFRLPEFLAQLPPCVVAMEACGGAHYVGRFCLQFGHEPRLMSPLYVRPYVKVHKNDDRDAEGIAEAATRPTMSFVPIKTEAQLDLQSLHRARERLVQDRTRLINQARGFLMERGIRPAQGRHVFQKFLTRLAEDHIGDLTPRMVTAQTMAWGIKLAEYYLTEANRLAEMGSVSAATARAEALRVWLLSSWEHEDFVPSDIMQYGPGSLRDRKILDAPLATLEKTAGLYPSKVQKWFAANPAKRPIGS